jgi:hypothetical protein
MPEHGARTLLRRRAMMERPLRRELNLGLPDQRQRYLLFSEADASISNKTGYLNGIVVKLPVTSGGFERHYSVASKIPRAVAIYVVRVRKTSNSCTSGACCFAAAFPRRSWRRARSRTVEGAGS